jgi:hypothetical protein
MWKDELPRMAGQLEENIKEKFWKNQEQIIFMNKRFIPFRGYNVAIITS